MARYPNFDTLRLAAAVSVIFSHAFLIAEGNDRNEPLVILSDHQLILGLIGVFVFFVASGFLVTQSFETTGDPVRFLRARLLRIIPGLAACLVLCAFVLGPLVTRLPLLQYLAHPGTYRFVAFNLLLQNEATLPGVVFSGKPAGQFVEGTFWTLAQEFICYLIVLGLGLAGLLGRASALALLGLGLASNATGALGAFGWILPYFAAGMCLYYWRDRLRGGAAAWLAAGLLVASARLGHLALVFSLCGAYLTILLATSRRLRLPDGARFGDLSYGLYIYGWPCEVAAAYLLGDAAGWLAVFGAALLAALPLAFLSWHLVEKPALRLKGRAAAQRPARSPGLRSAALRRG